MNGLACARVGARACAPQCCSVRVKSASVEFSPLRVSPRCIIFAASSARPELQLNFFIRLSRMCVVFFCVCVCLFFGASDVSVAPMFDLRCREVTRPIIGEALIIKGERDNLLT